MQKEKEIMEKIKQIVIDGGVVTIDCDDHRYTPAPMQTLEGCNKIICMDKDIKIDLLKKLIEEDSELEQRKPYKNKNLLIIVEKGTEIGVCCY